MWQFFYTGTRLTGLIEILAGLAKFLCMGNENLCTFSPAITVPKGLVTRITSIKLLWSYLVSDFDVVNWVLLYLTEICAYCRYIFRKLQLRPRDTPSKPMQDRIRQGLTVVTAAKDLAAYIKSLQRQRSSFTGSISETSIGNNVAPFMAVFGHIL